MGSRSISWTKREREGPTQRCPMTGHNLEIGVVVDLDIDGSGCTGGLEVDSTARTDVAEEASPVPRRLPLRFTS